MLAGASYSKGKGGARAASAAGGRVGECLTGDTLVLVEDLRAALGLAVIVSRIAEVGDEIFGLQGQQLRAVALTSILFQSLSISLEVINQRREESFA